MSKADMLEELFDKETSKILDIIASSDSKSDILVTRLNLTRKQYYSRMSILIRAGLVKRHKGRYFLTAFGKVIHEAKVRCETRVEDARKNYWTLQALDSLQMSYCPEGEWEWEWERIISLLVQDEEIKNALRRAGAPKIIVQSRVKKTRNVDENMTVTLSNPALA